MKGAMSGHVMFVTRWRLMDTIEEDVLALLLGLLFNPEDGDSMFLRNVSKLLPHYLASHPTRYCGQKHIKLISQFSYFLANLQLT
jgi:hypothetical protein